MSRYILRAGGSTSKLVGQIFSIATLKNWQGSLYIVNFTKTGRALPYLPHWFRRPCMFTKFTQYFLTTRLFKPNINLQVIVRDTAMTKKVHK